MSAHAAEIDALLPQTQCQRCGYTGCRPYAEAIASGKSDINRCPPGGGETIARLSRITGIPEKPLAPECGRVEQRRVAFIREDECIGCTKCIQVCPVDAIVGAAKQMHTVIGAECTGCELCVPACPVDCIDMPAAGANEGAPLWPPETDLDADRAAMARRRFHFRNARLQRNAAEKMAQRAKKRATTQAGTRASSATRKQEIAAAIARAKAKRDAQG